MDKSSVQVVIGGQILTMSGYEDEVYMQKIANYINNKYREFDEGGHSKKIKKDLRPVLVEINLADELMKERASLIQLEEDLAKKDEEIELLRQEIASLQVRCDRLISDNK